MTNRTFQDMLNEYLTYDLLKEELIKRDYVYRKVEKDTGWKGGTLPVPFKGSEATSVRFGALTNQGDISQHKYVRGQISDYKEAWGSLLFNQTDLVQHDGRINEDSFLRILPDQLEEFMTYMTQVVSLQLTTGPQFATAVGDGQVGGTIAVSSVDRFYINQKLSLVDDDTAAADYYVIAIDVATSAANQLASGTVTLSATRGGAAADISAYTTAANAKFFYDGVDATGATTFTSLKSALLSQANGGSASLYGVSKLAYPYLQAVNIDGSAITATNILKKIFDGYVEVRTKAKGTANEILMSYKHLGSIMKIIEEQKGGFKVTPTSEMASQFGWSTIEVMSVTGQKLTMVGIQEMDDDVIMYLDWKAVKFHTNGTFRKNQSPDGNEYFVIRAETGYQYICDIAMYGELVVNKPGHCGIIHSIPNYALS